MTTLIQKMSASSSLKYDYGQDNLGLTIELSPTWGHSFANAQNSLWSSNTFTNNNQFGEFNNGTQISSKVGYGFVFGENSQELTLYSGYEFDNQNDDELLFGSSVSISSNIKLDLEGNKKLSNEGSETSKLQLNGRLSW